MATAEYNRESLLTLTEELIWMIQRCVDRGDAEVTGCDMKLLEAIMDETLPDYDCDE